MSTIDNMTPDEVRLLDMAAMCAISTLGGITDDREKAVRSYNLAINMLAERRKRVRRKRVPVPMPTPIEHLRDAIPCGIVVHPQPEQGELTDEAVDDWKRLALNTYELERHDIDRAVALMREGLRAKQMADGAAEHACILGDKIADLQRTIDQGAADLAAADAAIVRAKKERDEARVRAERAEKAEAAFREVLEKWVTVGHQTHYGESADALSAHPAPKAEGGA